MTDLSIIEESYRVIERLAKSRSSNGAFAYYDNSDVYQEIWCMCLEAMKRYDPDIGPIENYLVRHVTNRMKNLKRDRYFRPGLDVSTSGLARTRMNLVNALPFGCCDFAEQGVLLCSTSINCDPLGYILCDETIEYILERLPSDMHEPFKELINNNKVRRPLVDEVRNMVAGILKNRDNDVKD